MRAAQLADTGLRSYKAEAHGYLTFLAQFGAGFPDPPKVVRTDEVASDIYWRAPMSSKQFIKGRRDTLLLPTDISYHRDHLGIVQNNFPSTIRIGDGDEVKDVPHPLSAAGLADYDFAVADSLKIQLGPRTLDVVQLRFRPRDANAPRAVGSVYVDRESGAVVRMAIGFTRAALRDKELEDLTVILESGLIEGRFWLPRRQEIEIRRTGTWLDYPARGIIRGRWDIADYTVNGVNDWVFDGGPEIEGAPGAVIARSGLVTSPSFKFSGNILDSLPPDVSAFASADVAKLRDEAQSLVGARALDRARGAALSGRAVSDFVHVNRVEGIAVGAGASVRAAPTLTLGASAMYGFSDRELKPQARLTLYLPGAQVTARGYRTLADASIVPERSGVFNTFAAQEFGSDYTDPYRVTGGSLAIQALSLPFRPSLELVDEDQRAASVHASPAAGCYEPTIAAERVREERATLAFSAPRFSVASTRISANLRLSAVRDLVNGVSTYRYGRGSLVATAEHPTSNGSVLASLIAAGIGSEGVPQQALVRIGGPVTAPGYDYHQFAGESAVSARLELHEHVPFVPVPLGAWGRAPATMTIAPYVNGAWIQGSGWHPSVGVGALTMFDLLRFDVARGLRGGRWTFNVDVSRDFWNIL